MPASSTSSTAPRPKKRGGVRFVDPATAEKAAKIADDPHTWKQLASDTLMHFLQVGAAADPTRMVGPGGAIIRVTVPQPALDSGVGFGRIDGQPQPVSIDTVKRLMKSGTIIRAGFDPTGAHINITDNPEAHTPETQNLKTKTPGAETPGADNRLFSPRQREILAAKFGGCMDPDCDRGPGWCEAHHMKFVKRDGGKTVIANGTSCKYVPHASVPEGRLG